MFKKFIGISLCFGLFATIGGVFAEKDIMEIMFEPAKSYEKIIDLGADKKQVGNEIFRESTQFGLDIDVTKNCTVNGNKISEGVLSEQMKSVGYNGSVEDFCKKILGGDFSNKILEGSSQTQAPLIVRITKFLLRITMVLAITMVLYNGILWIIESAKGGDVKDAQNNIVYVIAGILVALSSVALINLISSISISTIHVEEKENLNKGLEEKLKQAANAVGDGISEGLDNLGDTKVIKGVKKANNAVGDGISQAANWAGDGISEGLESVGDTLNNLNTIK